MSYVQFLKSGTPLLFTSPLLASLRQPIHEADTHVSLMETSRAQPYKARAGPKKVLYAVDSQPLLISM